MSRCIINFLLYSLVKPKSQKSYTLTQFVLFLHFSIVHYTMQVLYKQEISSDLDFYFCKNNFMKLKIFNKNTFSHCVKFARNINTKLLESTPIFILDDFYKVL